MVVEGGAPGPIQAVRDPQSAHGRPAAAVSPLLLDLDGRDPDLAGKLSAGLWAELMRQAAPSQRQPAFFLVGSPSSTGDSLGPFVGWFLRRMGCRAPFFGELNHPVHATNIADKLTEAHSAVARLGRQPFLVAVDAAVGRPGRLTLNRGPLRPGMGMGKQLPVVGQVHIMAGVSSYPAMLWFADVGAVVAQAEGIAQALMHFYDQWERASD